MFLFFPTLFPSTISLQFNDAIHSHSIFTWIHFQASGFSLMRVKAGISSSGQGRVVRPCITSVKQDEVMVALQWTWTTQRYMLNISIYCRYVDCKYMEYHFLYMLCPNGQGTGKTQALKPRTNIQNQSWSSSNLKIDYVEAGLFP